MVSIALSPTAIKSRQSEGSWSSTEAIDKILPRYSTVRTCVDEFRGVTTGPWFTSPLNSRFGGDDKFMSDSRSTICAEPDRRTQSSQRENMELSW